ncbi:MAG: type II toxin-antitoxin system HicB family antitoxin [Candidatus Eremiobacterota bacterium]
MLKYPGIIDDSDKRLCITFPDLGGSGTDGDTLEELIENAEDMLGAYLDVLIEMGKPIPKPSKPEGEKIIYIGVTLQVKYIAA